MNKVQQITHSLAKTYAITGCISSEMIDIFLSEISKFKPKEIIEKYQKNVKEKYFVYFLSDKSIEINRNYANFFFRYKPFYVGKGISSRIDSEKNKAVENKKKKMKENGIELHYSWIGPFEQENAFLIEKYFIDLLGRKMFDDEGLLLNVVQGGSGGWDHVNNIDNYVNAMQGKQHSEKTKKSISKKLEKRFGINSNTYGKSNVGTKGKSWYTDGVEEYMWLPDQIKNGFVKGRSKQVTEKIAKTVMELGGVGKPIQVKIDGISYSSLEEAGNIIGMGSRTVKKRYIKNEINN